MLTQEERLSCADVGQCDLLWKLSTEFHLGEPSVAQNCWAGGIHRLAPHESVIAAEQESNAATVILFSLVLCHLENTLQQNEVAGPGSTNCFISASCTQTYLLVFFLPPGRKVLIVYAHQEPKSFNGSLKRVAVEELSKQGCSVTVSDLYAMQFEPRATRNDIVGYLHNSEEFNYGVETWEAYKRGALSNDLIEEQNKVQEADLLIFQFPLYWFSMPAIMKGWMDRVLVQGFAFEFPNCYDSGLLKNKLALFSFTTGGSEEMYAKGGISGDIRYLLWPMQHGIMHFCGVKVLAPHICFAPECVSEEKRKEMLTAWAQRLKTLWKEEPINCSPEWYFK
uniref:Ribosyldihydronicotinamide dehydrogenase [quinone] n=1 Tax=Calidris pygmaea TaxID=425635 RepID=A0A8C3JUZ9_9CHAR